MQDKLTAGLVRILSQNGETAGAGFLLSDNGLIVTCSHVLLDCESQRARDQMPKRATVVFYESGDRYDARVEASLWKGCDEEDVAFLRIESGLSGCNKPLDLGASRSTENHPFQTHGFPKSAPIHGLAGTGTIVALTRDRHGYPTLQLSSKTVTAGFSGGPVYDTLTQRVIGMVTSIFETDEYGRQGETAYAIPSETLRTICQDLRFSDQRPYRGLEAFTEADAAFFYGRESAVNRLVASLKREPRFLAVLGPSGSGKTSLVQAGLVPYLRKGIIPGSDRWGVFVTRPANQPFEQLASEGLTGSEESLVGAVTRWFEGHPDHTRLVLIEDQFEDVLVTCPADLSRKFVSHLSDLLASSLPITVVIVLRDDFYSRLVDQLPELSSWLERGLVNVPRDLSPGELVDIVQRPATEVGLSFEPGLVQTIVQDAIEASVTAEGSAVGNIKVLPLLQFTLDQLWERRQDGVLLHQVYKDLGRITGSLTQWADQAYQSLDENLRCVAPAVLTRLVHLGDPDKGIPDCRQRLRVETLSDLSTEGRDAAERIVRHFADRRLLMMSADRQDGGAIVEIVHDVLIREWGLLRHWIDEDRRFLVWWQEIQQRIEAWKKTNPNLLPDRDEGKLLRGRDLDEAEAWFRQRASELGIEEQALIKASIALREREEQARKRLQRRTVWSLITGLVISLALAAVAARGYWIAKNNADIAAINEANALRQAQVSQSLAVAASAQTALANDHAELALALALVAVQIENPPIQSQRTIAEVAFAPGTRMLFDGNVMSTDPIEAGVVRVAFSPDGQRVLSGHARSAVQLWEVATGKEVRHLGDHGVNEGGSKPLVLGLAFSPDGRTAISAGGSDVRYWDLESGQEIRRITLGQRPGLSVAVFSGDNRVMLWGSTDGTVHLLDLESDMETVDFDGQHEGQVNDVALSADGLKALSASNDGTLRVWDTQTGKEIRQFHTSTSVRSHNPPGAYSAAFDPDGQIVAVGTTDGVIQLWDIVTGEEAAHLQGNGLVSSIDFSPDGQMIAACSSDKTVRVWDVKSGQELHRFVGHTQLIPDVEFSPDGSQILTGALDGTMRLWDLEQGTGELEISGHTARVSSLTIAPDNTYLLSSSWDGSLRFWSIETGKELRRLKLPDETHIVRAAISPDGRTILAASQKGLILLDSQTGKELRRPEGASDTNFVSVGFVPDTPTIFAVGGGFDPASREGSMYFWDRESGNEIFRFFDLGAYAASFAGTISPDGRLAALSAPRDLVPTDLVDGLSIWSVGLRQKTRELASGDWLRAVVALAFSPDNRTLLAGTSDGLIISFDAEDGTMLRTFEGHTDLVSSVAFSPDGHTFLSASADGTARIWNTQTGQEVRRFKSDEPIFSTVFSSDGRTAFLGMASGRINSWLISPSVEDLINWIMQNRYVRELTCLEREQYAVEPLCDSSGRAPTPLATKVRAATTPSPVPSQMPEASTVPVSHDIYSYSTEVHGVFSDTIQIQMWSFSANAGDQVDVTLRSRSFDPFLVLKGIRGELLISNDDADPGPSNDAAIRHYIVPETGKYTILVERYCITGGAAYGTGPYTLSIVVESHYPRQPVSLSKTERGRLGFVYDMETQPGSIVVTDVISDSAAALSGLQPGDSILTVAGADIHNSGRRQVVEALILPIGDILEMTVLRGASVFDIRMEPTRPFATTTNPQTRQRIEIGKKVSSCLNMGGSEAWQFRGEAGQTVSVMLGGPIDVQGYLTLYGPSGSKLAEDGRLESGAGWLLWPSHATFQGITLTETGTYTLTALSHSKEPGCKEYTLLVYSLKDMGRISLNQATTGKLPANGGHFWKFEGRTSQVITLRVQWRDGLLEPFVFLLGPDRTLVAKAGVNGPGEVYNSAASQSVSISGTRLPSDGQYTLILSPFIRFSPIPEELSGTYTVTVK